MASFIYNSYRLKLGDSSTKINLASDTIKLALLNASHTPAQDTHDFFDDVSANESSGTGYTAGGATLANQTWTQDNTNDRAVFDGDNVVFTISSALTARYAELYKSTGTAGTSPLIAEIDLATTYSLASGTLTFTWHANGIFYIS